MRTLLLLSLVACAGGTDDDPADSDVIDTDSGVEGTDTGDDDDGPDTDDGSSSDTDDGAGDTDDDTGPPRGVLFEEDFEGFTAGADLTTVDDWDADPQTTVTAGNPITEFGIQATLGRTGASTTVAAQLPTGILARDDTDYRVTAILGAFLDPGGSGSCEAGLAWDGNDDSVLQAAPAVSTWGSTPGGIEATIGANASLEGSELLFVVSCTLNGATGVIDEIAIEGIDP